MEPELCEPEERPAEDEPREEPLEAPLEMEPERDEPEAELVDRLGEDQVPRDVEPRPE